MNQLIFKKWFFEKCVLLSYPQGNNLPHKVVLLLDNAQSHPDVEQLKSADGNIFVAYFLLNIIPIA